MEPSGIAATRGSGPGIGGFNDHPESLIMVSALLVGGAGAFCATANELPDVGGWPPVAAAPGPAASIPARTARHHGTRHHRMYMMSVNRTHKGSLTPASNASPR
jgi:hypothetical protein